MTRRRLRPLLTRLESSLAARHRLGPPARPHYPVAVRWRLWRRGLFGYDAQSRAYEAALLSIGAKMNEAEPYTSLQRSAELLAAFFVTGDPDAQLYALFLERERARHIRALVACPESLPRIPA